MVFVRIVLLALAPLSWLGCGSERAEQPTLKQAAAGLFRVGVGIDDRIPSRSADWPLLLSQFDLVTPENCMKPQWIQPAEGVFLFDRADRFVAFAERHGLGVVGHCLVFARDDAAPRWLFRNGHGPADCELLLARLRTHIETVMGRYRGRIRTWDVVNEPIAHDDGYLRPSGFSAACGERFIAEAFAYAHAADPGATLVLGDYNNEHPAKREKLFRLVRSLRRQGVPVHAIALQGHYEIDLVPFRDIEDTLVLARETGVKVVVSELDIDVIPKGRYLRAQAGRSDPYRAGCPPGLLRRQAAQYAQLLALFGAHADVIESVSFWNLHDGQSWLNSFPWPRTNHPLLFDRTGRPKPAYDAVIEALTERTWESPVHAGLERDPA